ncbi:sensor histidine kinase [Paractinoplanes durhamensis]|uniref:histidine kinase n=1 Tax=Paractinoplanes durhamensis TaxID=113563 RepID=A0ABQ3Z9W0_9ACTN|nr:histidine kinase [Actinoplanes durhamensis]GIE06617.1 two-component sensor histidine kinase [Actinoplanes durhamensis]
MRLRAAAVPTALIVVGLATLPLIDRRSIVDRPVDVVAALLVLAAGTATALRHRLPVPALLAAAALTSAYLLAGYPYGPILLSVAVCVYAVARHHRPEWAAAWSLPALALLLLHTTDGTGLIPGAAWVVVPFTLGVARRQVVEAQRRERAETERRIADAERLRLAQEVHDVVGHGLAAIQMQADIALHLRDTRPDMAFPALAAISAASAEALDELRATLAEVTQGPGPGLARVGDLCDRIRTAGVTVDLTVDGSPAPLPAPADLAAYRVLQEALTNVVKHAAHPHARVAIHHGPRSVDLRVTNQARDAGHADGFGITGMRRRVELVGGTLAAGPGPGTFAVAAVIPRESP